MVEKWQQRQGLEGGLVCQKRQKAVVALSVVLRLVFGDVADMCQGERARGVPKEGGGRGGKR